MNNMENNTITDPQKTQPQLCPLCQDACHKEFVTPCKCSGSMGNYHKRCLMAYIFMQEYENPAQAAGCDICRTKYVLYYKPGKLDACDEFIRNFDDFLEDRVGAYFLTVLLLFVLAGFTCFKGAPYPTSSMDFMVHWILFLITGIAFTSMRPITNGLIFLYNHRNAVFAKVPLHERIFGELNNHKLHIVLGLNLGRAFVINFLLLHIVASVLVQILLRPEHGYGAILMYRGFYLILLFIRIVFKIYMRCRRAKSRIIVKYTEENKHLFKEFKHLSNIFADGANFDLLMNPNVQAVMQLQIFNLFRDFIE